MKTLVFLVMMSIGLMSMNAQNWYAGGSIGFFDTNASGKNSATFLLAPEAGYWFTNSMALGVALDMEFYKHYTGISISPYLRYSYFSIDKLSLFLDAGGTIPAGDFKNWKVGIEPGISFDISDRFTILSHMGFLGYRKFNERNSEGKKIHQTGLWLTNDLSFSLFYKF